MVVEVRASACEKLDNKGGLWGALDSVQRDGRVRDGDAGGAGGREKEEFASLGISV